MNGKRALTDDPGFLLSRASGMVARSVSKALAPLDLRVRSYSLLALATEHSEGIAQRQLADIIGLDPSQVVALVDQLEERGLVARTAAPGDRRTKLVTATEAGRQLYDEAHARVTEQDTHHFSQLSPAELEQLVRLLRQLAYPAEPAAG